MTFEEFDLFIKRSKKRWGKLYPYRPSVWIPRLKDVWYYFKCVLWKRHNVVKIRTLSPTWHDRDNMLLHASFQILVDFCEQELRTRPVEINYAEKYPSVDTYTIECWKNQDRINTQLWALYDWWTKDWPTYENSKYGMSCNDDKLYELETQKLKELIDLRQYMWT